MSALDTCIKTIRNFESVKGKKPKFILISKDIRDELIYEVTPQLLNPIRSWGVEYRGGMPYSLLGVEIAILKGSERIEVV